MTAIGFMLIGFGVVTAWSGFEKVSVFDVLRTVIGAPAAPSAPSDPVSPSSPTTPTQPGTGSTTPKPTPPAVI